MGTVLGIELGKDVKGTVGACAGLKPLRLLKSPPSPPPLSACDSMVWREPYDRFAGG